MPAVLTTASTVTCATQGTVTPVSGARLRVGGRPVLLATQVPTWTVAGCKRQTPCATVAPPTAGAATKLTVGGIPVLLDTLAALGSSGDPVTATANQSTLTAR